VEAWDKEAVMADVISNNDLFQGGGAEMPVSLADICVKKF